MKTIGGTLFVGLIALAFYIVYRASGTPAAQAAALAPINTQYATPTFRPTATVVPSATVGYEATIFVAQATADEARRVNAQATAEHEAYILSIMQLTAEAEKRNQEILSWTAQAAPTIIPLTATQQVVVNTQVAIGESRVSAMMTMTKEAPTQISAMARSQATVRFATVTQIANLAGMAVLVIFLLALVALITRLPLAPKPAPDAPKETVVQMRRDNGQGSFAQTRLVVPCTPEQLTELAEMAVNGEKRFGINRLETQSRTFRKQRTTLLNVRQFLIDHTYVVTDDNGTIALNADGEQFLCGWFDAHKLPDNYEFAPPLPLSHEHDTHTHDEKHGDFTSGGGQNPSEGEEDYTQEEVS